DARSFYENVLGLAFLHQERLGHKDIQVTLNTYSHLMPNMQKDASTFISGILQGKQKEESH
ncbi:hypothetical protein QOM20_06100, partial [Bacillus subtilis]